MPYIGSPSLTPDEIDDLLYFTRVNESQELQQTISELSQKYACSQRDIVLAGSDPESGNTILHYCCANGFTELLATLLALLNTHAEANGVTNSTKAPAPMINSTNGQGNTALHWAAYNGHLEVVKTLIGAGADMWIKNSAGHLAMFEAERADKNDVVQYLLEAGGTEVERTGIEKEAGAEDVVDISESAASAADT